MPSEWDYYGRYYGFDLHSEYFSEAYSIRFSTSFYDKNYLPVSYSKIIISKTHLNPTKPS